MATQEAISKAAPARGYGTEYTENFAWGEERAVASSWNRASSGLFDPTVRKGGLQMAGGNVLPQTMVPAPPAEATPPQHMMAPPPHLHAAADPTEFHSDLYPSVYRETGAPKDDRDNYHDSFRTIANKAYGRRLMYDTTHPEKMYPSQWSSELADAPGTYSFPTTTGLPPEIPFNRDLQWKTEGEVGSYPTDLWKQWRGVAMSPPYNGHDDQVEYSKYKVQVP